MADYTGALDGRKAAIRFSRAFAAGTTEDQAQISMHFLKISGGAPAPWVNGTDDLAVENAFGTLWNAIKADFSSAIHLDVYRWYLSGPTWDVPPPSPYNPAYRVTEVDVPGGGASTSMPSQTAISVTFKTSIRKRWGRVYMPHPLTSKTDGTNLGHVLSTLPPAWATAWQTFLNTCTTAHIQPCVMSRAHDAYTTPKGKLIAAQVYTYYSITAVQVDDIFDVIRSRRLSTPLVRSQQTVTPAT